MPMVEAEAAINAVSFSGLTGENPSINATAGWRLDCPVKPENDG